jgi:YVTN family beta-propeller protein
MSSALKSIGKFLLILVIIAIVGAGIVVAYLAYPGTPSDSSLLKFEGYIVLWGGKTLNILDYLTISNGALFVAGESGGSVFKIPLDSAGLGNSVMELRGDPEVHGVAVVPSKNLAFATRAVKNTVDVIDPDKLRLIASIPVAEDADAIIYDQTTNLIYVANGDANLATLIDPDKQAVVATIPLGGKPEYPAVDPRTGLLYQNLRNKNSVAVVNLASRSRVGEWPLAPCEAPAGLAIDSEHNRLFAVCAGNAKMVAFDMDKHQVISTLDIVKRPDSVAFDPQLHRIYAAGVGGKLTVIQQDNADTYRVVENIGTHYGAHTVTVDPITHKVYVGYASLLTRPRVAVFSATR